MISYRLHPGTYYPPGILNPACYYTLILLIELLSTTNMRSSQGCFCKYTPHSPSHQNSLRITVLVIPETHDIQRSLENKLEMDPEPVVISDSLQADILGIFPERISEMCVGASAFPFPCGILY